MLNCPKCKKDFPITTVINGVRRNLHRRKYCLDCSPFGQHNTRTLENANKLDVYGKCKNCGEILSRKDKVYCNFKCQKQHQYSQFIERWTKGEEDGIIGTYGTSNHIRRYLFEKYDSKCHLCGWSEVNQSTGKIPLEINHIDGNYKNNKEDNLELICPNCHSLTSNYKGANIKKGRHYRNK